MCRKVKNKIMERQRKLIKGLCQWNMNLNWKPPAAASCGALEEGFVCRLTEEHETHAAEKDLVGNLKNVFVQQGTLCPCLLRRKREGKCLPTN